MSRKITLTLGQYLLMSEAHIKNLVAQGFEVVIGDNAYQPKVDEPKVVNSKAVDTKPTTKKSSKKNTSSTKKGISKTNSKAATTTKPTLAFGKVAKNDYFKMFNLKDKNNPVLVGVGKALEVDKKDDTITYVKDGSDKKMVVLKNCVAITKKEFDKLSKRKALKHYVAKVSTTKTLSPTDYKSVYALYLSKNGKITEEEFALANSDQKVASEFYQKFKGEIKLSNADALKLFAEELKNSSAKAN